MIGIRNYKLEQRVVFLQNKIKCYFNMLKPFAEIIKYLVEKPKMLFLTDSIGAFVTSFLLFVILRTFNDFFGVSKSTLTYLAIIAACFCVYSTTCFFIVKRNWAFFIRVISVANLLYCMLSVALIAFNYHLLTIFGIIYFSGEIAIIFGLVYIELHVAAAINNI
jgi:hypothetical protein